MTKKDDFLAETILDIIRASNILERIGGDYAQIANLDSVQQYMILALLSKEDHLTMSDLRENTLVTKQAVTGIVNRLHKNGYIKKYKDQYDRRITRVCLTTKGREALTTIRSRRIEGNREVFSVLTGKEINQLSTIISKLVHHINKP